MDPPRRPSQTVGSIARRRHLAHGENSGFRAAVLRRDQGRNRRANRLRQPFPRPNYSLQISVNESQPTTIRATVLQRIRSAARWAEIATTIADSGYVRIELGFDSHRRLFSLALALVGITSLGDSTWVSSGDLLFVRRCDACSARIRTPWRRFSRNVHSRNWNRRRGNTRIDSTKPSIHDCYRIFVGSMAMVLFRLAMWPKSVGSIAKPSVCTEPSQNTITNPFGCALPKVCELL